jgi:hypothetical protein
LCSIKKLARVLAEKTRFLARKLVGCRLCEPPWNPTLLISACPTYGENGLVAFLKKEIFSILREKSSQTATQNSLINRRSDEVNPTFSLNCSKL